MKSVRSSGIFDPVSLRVKPSSPATGLSSSNLQQSRDFARTHCFWNVSHSRLEWEIKEKGERRWNEIHFCALDASAFWQLQDRRRLNMRTAITMLSSDRCRHQIFFHYIIMTDIIIYLSSLFLKSEKDVWQNSPGIIIAKVWRRQNQTSWREDDLWKFSE